MLFISNLYADTNKSDKSGTTSGQQAQMCNMTGGTYTPGASGNPLGKPFCLNSLTEKTSLKPDPNVDPMTLISEDPNNLNVSRGDLPYTSDVRRLQDGFLNPGEDMKALKELASRRFKSLTGLDINYLKKCTGMDLPDPSELFQLRFEDGEALTDQNMGASFSKKLKTQCLKVEFNPKYAQFMSIMRLATGGNEFVDYSDKQNPKVLKCANLSNKDYCGGMKYEVLNKIKEYMDPACVANANTQAAFEGGATFGYGDPRDKTFMSDGQRQGICDYVKNQMSKDNSPQSQKDTFKNAEKLYFDQCKASDYFYSWVETGFKVGSNIIVIAGSTVLLGPWGAIVVSACTTSMQTYNNCYREIPESVVYGGTAASEQKLAEAQNGCYVRAAKDGALDALVNTVTAGFGTMINKAGTTLAKEAVKDIFTEGLSITGQLMRKKTLSVLLSEPGIRGILTEGADLTSQFLLERTRCVVQKNYIDEKADCSNSTVFTNLVQGQIISKAMHKTMNLESYKKATPEQKKIMLEEAQTNAKNSKEYKEAPQNVAKHADKLNEVQPVGKKTKPQETRTNGETNNSGKTKEQNNNNGSINGETGGNNNNNGGKNKVKPDNSKSELGGSENNGSGNTGGSNKPVTSNTSPSDIALAGANEYARINNVEISSGSTKTTSQILGESPIADINSWRSKKTTRVREGELQAMSKPAQDIQTEINNKKIDEGRSIDEKPSQKIDSTKKPKEQLDELFAQAEQAQKDLNATIKDIYDDVGALAGKDNAYINDVKAKSASSTVRKIIDEKGPLSELLDLSRHTLVYKNPMALYANMGKLKKMLASKGIEIVRIKDRIVKPVGGYQDILLNIKMPNGHIAELQLGIEPVYQAKMNGLGHKFYENFRDLNAKSQQIDNQLKKTTDANQRAKLKQELAAVEKRKQELEEASTNLYNDGYNQSMK